MPLLFAMSLFGSIAALFYMIVEPFAKRHFSISWRRIYLICNILCFVFPFYYFYGRQYKILLTSVYEKLILHESKEEPKVIDITGDIIQISKKGIYMEDACVYVLLAGAVIVSVILLYRQCRKYRTIKTYLNQNKKTVEQEGNVSILKCDAVATPFTMGVFRPIVVLPDIEWDTNDLEYVIEHEMTHIRQKDNLIKILALCMVAMHFYNPFAYYILYKWNTVAELSCDTKVLIRKSKEEIKQYGLLVIRMAQERVEHRLLPVMGFQIQKKEMEERIQNIKNSQRKKKTFQSLIGAGVLCVAMLLSSFSVLAYDVKDIWFQEELADEIIFYYEGYFEMNMLVGEYGEWIFVTEDEVEIPRQEDERNASASGRCRHFYRSCIARSHEPDGAGGCIIEEYNARRCIRCEEYIIEDHTNTITWVVCTH